MMPFQVVPLTRSFICLGYERIKISFTGSNDD